MASRFARIRRVSPLALGISGTLGLYFSFTSRKYHADSPTPLRVQWTMLKTSKFNPQEGIRRVDSISIPSNSPSEDVYTSAHVKSSAWSLWSVYDGHAGPQTAWHLEEHLIPSVLKALQPLYHDGVQPAVEAIHRAIKATFLAVDAQIVQQPTQYLLEQSSSASPPTDLKAVGARLLQTARSGSCALVAFYEANIRHLHVAVVGDSRAILGRRRKVQDGGPLYEVHVLSADQTPRNPKELARTTAEHPGEDLALNGRFLGWAITRAFGNGTMKWSLELQEFLLKNFLGSPARSVVKTPPYFTAEPEVTLTTVEPGDFMIMASDGLWDCLTNEEVVGLVGIWLERTHGEPSKGTVAPGLEQEVARDDLPVELKEDKTQNYENWNAQKLFVNVDSNVAHHLARNAFGGADDDLHNALLSTAAPRARYIRDDLAAVVVFFD